MSRDLLSAVNVPTYLLSDFPNHCSRADILECVNRYYNEIVHALYIAACVTIPQKKYNSYWWDKELSQLKGQGYGII